MNDGGVGANVGGAGANVFAGGAGANVFCGGGAAGASGAGEPVNFPIPGKRSPMVRGLCPGMTTDGVWAGGGGAAGTGAGAVGTTQSFGFGGAAVSQSVLGGAGVAAGPGTRPSATRRGSTSSVIRSPSSGASVG